MDRKLKEDCLKDSQHYVIDVDSDYICRPFLDVPFTGANLNTAQRAAKLENSFCNSNCQVDE